MYTQRAPGRVDISRSTANSAQMVLPEPVGAPMSAFSSDEKSVEKTCHVETRGETDGIGRALGHGDRCKLSIRSQIRIACLRLYRVEVRERAVVQRRVLPERRERQRLEVEQLRVRRVLLR